MSGTFNYAGACMRRLTKDEIRLIVIKGGSPSHCSTMEGRMHVHGLTCRGPALLLMLLLLLMVLLVIGMTGR